MILDKVLARLGLERKTVKPEPEPQAPAGHVAGPVSRTADTSELAGHVPELQMALYDRETGEAMRPEQVASARQEGTLQPVFFNPNQTLDYRILGGICKSSIAGPLMDGYTQLIMGAGFHPELELVNPSGDSERDQAELARHQSIIRELQEIERMIDGANDISFREYVSMLIGATNIYGRAALVWDAATTYRGIPTTVKFAHPEDLSITVFDPRTWRLDSVLWQKAGSETVKAEHLVYLWNPLITAKYKDAWQYGGSMVLPMLDALKTLKQIIGSDFPAMARTTWAGTFLLTVRNQGQTRADKLDEYGAIAKNLTVGRPNILMENPEDVRFDGIDFEPKVLEFKELAEFLIRYCLTSMGLPQTTADEGQSNRSAARSKLQYMMAAAVNPVRERLGRQLARQTYQKWFLYLHPELAGTVRIRFAFEELRISEWYDRIEAALRVDSRHELTDEGFGKLAEIDTYLNIIKPEAETSPGGTGERPHNLQRDNDGKNLDVGLSKNREGLE